jgi:hypothetical protein
MGIDPIEHEQLTSEYSRPLQQDQLKKWLESHK